MGPVAGCRDEGHRILQRGSSSWFEQSAGATPEEKGCLGAGSQQADQENTGFSRGSSFQGVCKKDWNAVGTAFEVFGQETGLLEGGLWGGGAGLLCIVFGSNSLGFSCRKRTSTHGSSVGIVFPLPPPLHYLRSLSSTCKMIKAWGSSSQSRQIRYRLSGTKSCFEVCLLHQINLFAAWRRKMPIKQRPSSEF